MNLLGNAHHSPHHLKPLLDSEANGEETLNTIRTQENIFYEELDLSSRVEGVDYYIKYGADDDEVSE
jgi:hypothetical protein